MATRSASSARNEILDLLKADHRKVKQVFRKFEDVDIEGDPEAAREMVLQVCEDLEVHALLEEELFYPAVREAIKDAMVVAEAEVEHAGAKMLIAEPRELDPADAKFAASFIVLGEYVKHHISDRCRRERHATRLPRPMASPQRAANRPHNVDIRARASGTGIAGLALHWTGPAHRRRFSMLREGAQWTTMMWWMN